MARRKRPKIYINPDFEILDTVLERFYLRMNKFGFKSEEAFIKYLLRLHAKWVILSGFDASLVEDEQEGEDT